MSQLQRLLIPRRTVRLYTLLTTTYFVRNISALSQVTLRTLPQHTHCSPRNFWQIAVRPLCTHYDKWVNLSYEDLVSLLEDGDIQLFDVREPEELEETGQIPGAVNIPLDDVESAFKLSSEAFLSEYGVEQPKHTDTNIVFQCLAGYRSQIALETAINIGFTKARNYIGGWEEWSHRNPENIDYSKRIHK